VKGVCNAVVAMLGRTRDEQLSAIGQLFGRGAADETV
jgi:hypothetical protein